MRKLTADHVLLPSGNLGVHHTLLIEDDGTVVAITDEKLPDAEKFNGILTPGFINSHCHLELSYMKGMIPEGTGLPGFIEQIIDKRSLQSDKMIGEAAIHDRFMWENGIQAVGDICNSDHCFELKSESKIRYYNFIEVFGLNPLFASRIINTALEIQKTCTSLRMKSSIVPHTPYSVSEELFQFILKERISDSEPWSMHHLESNDESDLVENGNGRLADLYKERGILPPTFHSKKISPTAFSSLFFPPLSNILLVHNTYINESHLEFLKNHDLLKRVWFCLCPSANLYIEGRLPDIDLLRRYSCNIVIGTDSLASNHKLSIAHEMEIILKHYKNIAVDELLRWVTINAASFFSWKDLGSFNPYSKPGVIILDHAYNPTRLI